MKRELKETEKNFLICAGLIIIAGVGMVIMGKTFFGGFSVLCGLIFAIVAIRSILTTEGPKRTPQTKEIIIKEGEIEKDNDGN